MVQHDFTQIVGVHRQPLRRRLQMAPASGGDRLERRPTQARGRNQHQSRNPMGMLLAQQCGHHRAKRESDELAGRLTDQLLEPLLEHIGHGIGIATAGRQGRIAETGQVGHQQAAPACDQVIEIAQPVRPAAAAAMQEHQRQRRRRWRRPLMPNELPVTAGGVMATRAPQEASQLAVQVLI